MDVSYYGAEGIVREELSEEITDTMRIEYLEAHRPRPCFGLWEMRTDAEAKSWRQWIDAHLVTLGWEELARVCR